MIYTLPDTSISLIGSISILILIFENVDPYSLYYRLPLLLLKWTRLHLLNDVRIGFTDKIILIHKKPIPNWPILP